MILSIAWVVFITYALLGVFIISGLFRIPRTKAVSEPLPTVSLLISCRNEEKDIDDCLRSLAQLTYPKDKLQIILVDDYSTDATPAKLKAFADQYDHAAFYSGEEFPETHLEAKGRGIAQSTQKHPAIGYLSQMQMPLFLHIGLSICYMAPTTIPA